MNPLRSKASSLSWLSRFFSPRRRQQTRRRRPLAFEVLEERELLSSQTVDLGPLRFLAPAFTKSGDQYQASGTIQLGLAPTKGEAFTPLVDIQGSVVIPTDVHAPAFSVTGATLAAPVQGASSLILWQSPGVVSFSVAELTTTGRSLADGGQVFSFDGANFTPNSLLLFNPNGGGTGDAQVRLQGSLGIEQLKGLDEPVAGSNFLVLDQVGVTDFSLPVTDSFQMLGLVAEPTSLTLTYTRNNGTFAMAGGLHVSTSNGQLSQAAAVVDTEDGAGFTVQSGVIQTVDFNLTGDFTLHGLPVHPVHADSLKLRFDGGRQTFVLYGDATLPVHGTGTTPLPADFGDADGPGATIANGEVQDVTLGVDGFFEIYSLAFKADNATLQYNSSAGHYELTGSITLPYLLFVRATLGGTNPVVIDDGRFQLDNFQIQFEAIPLGAFWMDNLVLTFTSQGDGYGFGATFDFIFPTFRVNGTVGFDDRGRLNALGLFYQSSTGIEILDTGIFLNGLGATVQNFENPSDIIVSGTVALTYGGSWPIGDGRRVTAVKAVGSFTVDKDMLVLDGKVFIAAYTSADGTTSGLLGEGEVKATLNWGSNDYKLDASFGWAGGLFKLRASIDIGGGGDSILVRADAEVDVPDFIPFIGGTTLASANFALVYHSDWSSSQNFAAAWVKVDLYLFSFDIGFKVNFDGHVSLIGNKEVGAIDRTFRNPHPQTYEYLASFEPPPGATRGTFSVAWPVDRGSPTLFLQVPDSSPQGYTEYPVTSTGLPNFIKLGDPQTPGTSITVHVAGDATDEDRPLHAGRYQLLLRGSYRYPSAPTFRSAFGFPKPTIAIRPLPDNPSQPVPLPVTVTVDEAFTGQARVSFYVDGDAKGYDGTPIPGLVNLPYQPGMMPTWDLKGLLPVKYYVYAVINDGFNTPVHSAYSNPVTPKPPLSGIVSDSRNGGRPLSGFLVYLDQNQNGRFDPGIDKSTTNGSGFYSFDPDDLPRDTPFYVGVVVPRGYRLAEGAQNPVQRTYDGVHPVEAPFDVNELASIRGTVFIDLNRNGRQDADEKGRPGWTIYLDANGNGRRDDGEAKTKSDSDGSYVFYEMAPNASYRVALERGPGQFQTSPLPVPPGTYTATFGSDPFQHITGLDFGTLKLASISGTVRGYHRQGGQLDPNGTGLSGWTVQLWQDNQLVATTTTAADGSYTFPNVRPGEYTIREVVPAGWRQVAPFQSDFHFADPVTVSDAIPAARSLTAGDFDRDGHVDFAATWQTGTAEGIRVYFGLGDGTFAEPVSLPFANVWKVIEFQADGPSGVFRLGVISTTGEIHVVGFDLGREQPQVLLLARLPAGADLTHARPGYVVKGNFDDDQQEDLAFSYYKSTTDRYHLTVVLANGQVLDQAYGDGTAGGGLAAGDLNGDGKLDLLINGGAPDSDGPVVAYNRGGGVFTQPFSVVDDSITTFGGAAALGDINGDGFLDGVVVNNVTGAGVAFVFLNDQSGRLQSAYTILLPAGQTDAQRVLLADLDGDLRDDLLIFQGGTPWLAYLNQGSTPYFLPGGVIPVNSPNGSPADIALADLNGDGLLDMLVADEHLNGVLVYLNQSGINQTGIDVFVGLEQDLTRNDFLNTQLR
jgi:hypothetical protein